MTLEALIVILQSMPPVVYEDIYVILTEIMNHDDEARIVRHAEVLAAKAELGIK